MSSASNTTDATIIKTFAGIPALLEQTPALIVRGRFLDCECLLGPMLENNLRKSLILSQGDLMTFVTRPISAACLALAVVLLVGPLLPSFRKKRELVALDEGA